MHATAVVRRLGLAALAVGAAVLSASALAHTQGYDTKITIRERQEGVQYGGRVISDRRACERNRRVKFFRANGDFVNDTETDGQGRWNFAFVGERYYATAPKAVKGAGDHRHVCKFDRSPTTE